MPVFITLKGQRRTVDVGSYRVNWTGKSLSKFQAAVKTFLFTLWGGDIVYEEFPVVGTKMHIDLYNATLKIAVECDGAQHSNYNPFFHNGSLSSYYKQINKDSQKWKWCKLNNITLVRITEADVKNLSPSWLAAKLALTTE